MLFDCIFIWQNCDIVCHWCMHMCVCVSVCSKVKCARIKLHGPMERDVTANYIIMIKASHLWICISYVYCQYTEQNPVLVAEGMIFKWSNLCSPLRLSNLASMAAILGICRGLNLIIRGTILRDTAWCIRTELCTKLATCELETRSSYSPGTS